MYFAMSITPLKTALPQMRKAVRSVPWLGKRRPTEWMRMPKWQVTVLSFCSIAVTTSVLLALLLLPSLVFATNTTDEPHQSIRNTAQEFLQQQLQNTQYSDFQIKVARLDSRLKLSHCDRALEGFLPQAGQLFGKLSVGVRCAGSKPWSIYVPCEVDVYQQVLAAARPILRGQSLEAADIQTIRQKITPRNQAYFYDSQDVINMVAQRNIPLGRTFTPQLVQAPRLIHRGEQVILMAETSSLTVRMTGEALSDGVKGEVIQVRNAATRRVVEGVVLEQGIVQVKM